MLKTSFLALVGAMAFTTAAQVHPIAPSREPFLAPLVTAAPARHVRDRSPATAQGRETLTVYYTPLKSTEVARYAGFGMAYHMAVVYTDAAGRSFGASSGPSDLKSPQTAANALTAVISMANEQPSGFGTLVSDPNNDTPFTVGAPEDYYTKDVQGRPYPHQQVARGANLAPQWTSILRTYTRIGAMGLSYAPMSQNSNSLATTALRRAGIDVAFSSDTVFTPGSYTVLP